MTDRIRTEDFEFYIDVEEDYEEFFETGIPYNEELDFNKEIVTEYLPEEEDDYWKREPVEDE